MLSKPVLVILLPHCYRGLQRGLLGPGAYNPYYGLKGITVWTFIVVTEELLNVHPPCMKPKMPVGEDV
jgi:hypothetical protein